MPKCTVCGKKFDTISALQDHHRAVHPGQKFAIAKSSPIRTLTVVLVVVLIAVGGGVGYLIYTQSISGSSTTTSSGILNTPISTALYDNLTGVSFQTLSAVGGGQGITPPKAISPPGQALSQNGKPEILYIGAEFCPYCAAERWSLVVALSKFGNFSDIEYMQSALNDLVPNGLATLSFRNATYVSQYIAFVSVENEDRNHVLLQSTTSTEQQLWNQYTSSQDTYPFVYISNATGGFYVVSGAQYTPSDISNLNWTQIGSQLNNPNSNVAKAIDGAANTLITGICMSDRGQPSSVCGQSFAKLTLVSFSPSNQASTNMLVLSGISREKTPAESLDQSGAETF
jgi:hypothetical protein